jgi:hypothetical protein
MLGQRRKLSSQHNFLVATTGSMSLWITSARLSNTRPGSWNTLLSKAFLSNGSTFTPAFAGYDSETQIKKDG